MRGDLMGETLLNQFRVDGFIAAGGMATIYRVWDLQRSVPLAMKVLHPELASDPSFIARFEREARTLQALVHPHIVPFYGIYRAGDLTFLLERYIDGPSLDEVLRRRGGSPLPLVEALVYFKALYTSLGYAHAQGIIHCDVKPGNVLIDQGGSVYLTDFGISRYMDAAHTTTATLGTPMYMAPEQIRGERLTPQTDVYSLGVVLFELLTGQRPFRGENVPAGVGGAQSDRIRYQHLYTVPPDPRSLNPRVPDGLAQVVLRALAKDPGERYPGVQAMADEIARVVAARFETLPDRVRLTEDPGADWSMPEPEPVRPEWQEPYSYHPAETLPGQAPAVREAPAPAGVPSARQGRRVWLMRLLALAGVLILLVLCGLGLAQMARGLGGGPDLPDVPALGETPSPEVGETLTGAVPQAPSPSPSVEQPAGAPGDFAVSGQIAIVRRSTGGDRLFLLDAASGEQQALPGVPNVTVIGDSAPQWSPDGRRLVWVSQYAGRLHVAAMDLEENEPYQIPAGEAYSRVSSPAFLPDGNQISFWAPGGTGGYLVTADAVSGERMSEIGLSGYRNMFVWNRQNGQAAYIFQGGGSYEVAVGSPDGEGQVMEAGGEGYAPAWSNDGAWLAWQSDAGRDSGMNEIWIVRADGSQMRRVTTTPAEFWSRAPTWSPDGRMIAFVSNQSGSIGSDFGELFVVEVETGKIRQITSTGGQVYDWRPAWRP